MLNLNWKTQVIRLFRNRERFKRAILFYCGGLEQYPDLPAGAWAAFPARMLTASLGIGKVKVTIYDQTTILFNQTFTVTIIDYITVNESTSEILRDKETSITFTTYDELNFISVESTIQILYQNVHLLNISTNTEGFTLQSMNLNQLLLDHSIDTSYIKDMVLTIKIYPKTSWNSFGTSRKLLKK